MIPKQFLFILLTGTAAAAGCKKLVDVAPPNGQVVTTTVFANDNTTIAAQLAIYTQLQGVPGSLEGYTGLSSDELANYSSAQLEKDLYLNNLNAGTDSYTLLWTPIYNIIYQENAIIENLTGSTAVSRQVKTQTLGEAEFVRAYCYFYLTNLYGDVPLVTSTNYKINSIMARSAQSTVYAQMVVDLLDAQSKLSSNYLDATDTAITVDRVRPTSWAASALVARVYLYMGKYDSAALEASKVINNTALFGMPALSAVFKKNSTEAIWEIMPPTGVLYTTEGNYFILTKSPASSSSITGCCAISTQLLNSFESGDGRKTAWVGIYPNSGTTFYFPSKYKNSNSVTGNPSGEYSMVLRLAEQYLIRAEAEVQTNDLDDAINDINVIRTRAGLTGVASTVSQAQVMAAILHERQIEFFAEAQRWLDLKRMKIVDSVMSVVTNQKGGSWNTDQQLYPLEANDVQEDLNLTQNPGY